MDIKKSPNHITKVENFGYLSDFPLRINFSDEENAHQWREHIFCYRQISTRTKQFHINIGCMNMHLFL